MNAIFVGIGFLTGTNAEIERKKPNPNEALIKAQKTGSGASMIMGFLFLIYGGLS